MKDTIFKCTQTMPPTCNSPDVTRTALSFEEMKENLKLGISPTPEFDVVNIDRPVRGRPY